MAKKFSVYTLGCKVNTYESEAVKKQFENNGYTCVDFDEFADDLVVVVKKGEKADFYNPLIEGYSLTYYYNEQEFNLLLSGE